MSQPIPHKKSIHIIGAGPAGLMAGYQLLKQGHSVQFYDHKKSAGRKFLVAGKGGFNLTHSLELETFVTHYSDEIIKEAVRSFTNSDTIDWLLEIGIPTYIGSSGKIFPEKGIKPIEVLDALKNKLLEFGAVFHFEHQLIDFSPTELSFQINKEVIKINYSNAIFALGGGSWKKTGSDGSWQNLFLQKGIKINDFQSSNAGMICKNWPSNLEGEMVKNCTATIGNQIKKGEVRFTNYGLEGAPIYALNHQFRSGINLLTIDLKPSYSIEKLTDHLSDKKTNRAQQLQGLKIPKKVIEYIKSNCTKEEYLDSQFMAHLIKKLPFTIKGLRPVDEAISTVGGVDMEEITTEFQLKKFPSIYCIGEMLDWDAPTGGYLLQACFSTGFIAGKTISIG